MKTTNSPENIPSNEVGPKFEGERIKCPDLVKHIIDFYNGKIDFEQFNNLLKKITPASYFNYKKSFLKFEGFGLILEFYINGGMNIKLIEDFNLKSFIKGLEKYEGNSSNYYSFKNSKKLITKKMLEEIAWILYFIENMMNKDINNTKDGVAKKTMDIL